ncbi:MAG: leucine-rich repeat protein [Paludibacteraceae bacterium]|nr:leucine-rich repeat protein [Paludibacteraceae bacterium]
MRKILSLWVMLAMLLPAMANLTGKQGTCTYDLDSVSGVLTIRSSDDAPSWGGELKIDNPLFGSPFAGNKAIREVVIAEGVSEIGTGAFLNCSRIEKISFPSTCGVLGFISGEYDEEGLEALQVMPFMGCTGLRTIEMRQRYSPDLPNYHYFEEFNETTLGFDPKQVTLVVYDESVQTYKEHAKTWGRMNYATFPAVAGGTFGDGLTWQMSGNGKLTVSGSGAMPDLKALKDMPWAPYADQLTEVMICEGITHVGAYSFVYCSKIEKVYLPATLQSIGEQAFAYTSGLTEITCAAAKVVPTLPDNAFASFGDMKRSVYVYSFMTDAFKADAQWGNESNFRIVEFRAAMTVLPAAEITAETRGENAVYVSWPVVEGAEVIVITVLSGVNNEYQFVFDGKGHIAQYNRNAPRPEKKDSDVDGMEFVLPGLESDTEYEISVVAKDAEDKELVSYKAKVKTSAPKKDKQAPHDALAGRFSINSDGDVVAFSPGNLRYNAATQLWSFAPAQNAIVGADNANISDSYDGDIDLFGWGTSGYNGVMPYLTDDNDNIYAPTGKDITGTNYDWGLFNKAPWRTMTAAEWEYLLSTRENAADKNGNATVDEVPGLVLLPDEWTLPEGLTFTAQPLDYTTNTYTAGQWAEMEAAGAVFLPAAARRQVKDMYNITSNRRGYYWTSSIAASDDRAQFVDFRPAKTVTLSNDYLSTGYSVRLAMDITRHTVTFVDYDGAELKKEVVEEGKSATAPEDPSRDGYTFTGWDKEFANVTSDLTVTAQYEPATSGICGQDGEGNLADNLTWSYNKATMTLTIEGTGAMYNYNFGGGSPWKVFGEQIESIILPEGLTSIGADAFNYCISIKNIVIPDNVTAIGRDAFSWCTSLVSVDIPDNVQSIGAHVFEHCTALESIVFPDNESFTYIGVMSLSGCEGLKTVTIPASVSQIDLNAFSQCSALKTIYCYAVAPPDLKFGSTMFAGVDQANCKLYVHTKSIDAYKSAARWNMFDIEGMEKIFTVTFVDYDGTELKKESVIEGEAATAPADPTREGYTFTSWDKEFANVTADLTVTAQYERITSGICGQDGEGNLADNLTWSFDTETGVLTIEGTGAMYDYDGYNDVYAPWQDLEVKQVVLPDGLTTIGNYAFYWSINLTSVDIPEGVTTIGNYAFFYTGLTSVDIPEGVTTIGNYAFSYTGLTSVVIPESVTTIGEGAFGAADLTTIDVDANNPNYCSVDGVLFNKDKTTLIQYPVGKPETTYSIPNSVITIGNSAFSYCYNLTSIVIPKGVTSIGKYAFAGCDGLETIYDYAVTPQELIWDEWELNSPFDGVKQANCKLYVPAKAVEAYQAAKVWQDFDIEAYFFDVTFFDYDGTELKTEQVSKGSAATAPADPSREGYTFTGWDPADYSHVTTDLTVTAQYKINTFTVIFLDFNGEPIGEPQTVEYGSAAAEPEAPEVTGYHFVEWDSNYNEIYSDMTVKAVYEKNEYTVKFVDWDGSELSSQVVKFEEAAIAPEDPTREGYTFKGWDKAFDVITEDLTVTAQYVQNDPTGILSPTLRKEGEKVLRDGVLYILRDGKIYNANGALLK